MIEQVKTAVETPFLAGVHSVLKVEWELELVTPLCIKNGHSFAWKSVGDGSKKRRNYKTEFKWNKPPKGDENEIADLHYSIFIENGKPVPKYQVPASSLRGALRAWTIRHLVNRFLWDEEWHSLHHEKNKNDLQNFLKPDFDAGKIKIADIRKIVINKKYGFGLVAGLFGMTLENLDDKENYAHAGRLYIETEPFKGKNKKLKLDTTWMETGNNYGPNNAVRQITWRGPVDRITHGAKDKGFHTFLEFEAGQSFNTFFTIINPKPVDLGLLRLWQNEINTGFLRLGGLASVGRGRLEIMDNSTVWYSKSTLPKKITKFRSDSKKTNNEKSVLNETWKKYPLDISNKVYETDLFDFVKNDLQIEKGGK